MAALERYWMEQFRVYGPKGLSEGQIHDVVHLITDSMVLKHSVSDSSILGGRSIVTSGAVRDIGDVVVKGYRRGGFLRFFVGDVHMRFAQSRSRKEFKILDQVLELGVRAPKPIAYVERGAFWYRAWLLTKRIAGAKTLVEIALQDEEQALQIGREAAKQMSLLIKGRIHHVDLHPGNVVVGDDNLPYIVDFDKAHRYNGSLNELRDQYLRRWRRAVIKHKLPEVLCEAISLELRNNYE